MNNNVNHTEKDMEQRITETLDRCMSGIDTAPSLRPIVDKKLEENPRPEKRHIPVRRFAVPAVALALCVCLIVTGTHFGMFRWPDRIRTPETAITAQPVPLAQPEGEGGEGNPAPDGSTEPSLLDNLSTVIASCENAGIRFEVHSAEVYEQHTRVLCSVQDLTGDHRIIAGGLKLYPYPGFSQDVSGPSLTFQLNNGCVEEERRIWYLLDFAYDGIDDRSDRMVTISADNIPIPQESGEADEWIQETWSVQLPLKSILKDTADYPEKYSEEFFASRLSYTVNEDGTATVVRPVNSNAPFVWNRLVIPKKLDGRYVTAIADGAFEGCFKLEAVYIPDCLNSIGARAFSGCTNLYDIKLLMYLDPNEDEAFLNNNQPLTTFPYYLASIGDEAFRNANLQYVDLPENMDFIGENAFDGNHSLMCLVSDGSYAEEYCQKNNIPYKTWIATTTFPPAESIPADIPDPTAAAEFAEWNDWGTTPMPPMESFPIEFPDPTAAAEFAEWNDWGTTPMPPIESLPIEVPGSTVSEDFAQWDSWGTTPVPSLSPILPEEAWQKWMVDDGYGSEVKLLRPVGLSCEKGGIRFTVEAAGADGSSLRVLYTLKDLQEGRISIDTQAGLWDFPSQDLFDSIDTVLSHFDYDESEQQAVFYIVFNPRESAAAGENRPVNISLDGLTICDEIKQRKLVPYYEKYGEAAKTMLLADAPAPKMAEFPRYPSPEYRILDCTDPLDIQLAPYYSLSGIGLIDGELHVRIRYTLDNPGNPSSYIRFYNSRNDGGIRTNTVLWETDSDGSTDMEYIFPWNGTDEVTMSIPNIIARITESWQVSVPLDSIRIDTENDAAAPDGSAEWAAAPEEPWQQWMQDEGYGREARSLRPVGLSCESEGIRFTVEAAAVDDESIDLLYSLEDLEGNRINEETHIWGAIDVMCNGIGEYLPRTSASILYTPGQMSARLSHYVTDGTAVPGNNQPITFSLDDLGLISQTIVDLAPYLEEYGESAKATSLAEELTPNWTLHWADNTEYPSRILDIASPLDISLNPNIRLDGIGIIDGQCHVRLRYVDNEPFAESSGLNAFRPVDYVAVFTSDSADGQYVSTARRDVSIIDRKKTLDNEVDEQEFIFPLENKTEIPLYIRSCSGIVDGNWKIELPLDSIWTSPEDYAGTDTPGYYESCLTYTLNEDGTAVVKGRTGKGDFRLMRHLVIPAELDGHPVTAVADNAFMDWSALESVVLPDTVTAIGDRAFLGCTRLESVDLPEGLRTIGEQAFFDTGLRKVIIPDSVISFGNQAFALLYPGDELELEIPRTAELITWCSTNRIPFTIRDSEPAE